jgi:Protein of unknown function (DUF1353)
MSTVLTPLRLVYIDGDTWMIESDFQAVSDRVGLITCPAGSTSDFNSVPRPFTNILPREEYGESGVLHDRLYRTASTGLRSVTREDADHVHREFLIWKGAPAWKVRVMFSMLRAFGWITWNKYRAAEQAQAAA